ncbi:MAG: hypothetical protein ABI703_08480, partial [Gemmatimonadales bacterium]
MFDGARLHLKHLILWAVPLAGLACGGDGGTDVVLPPLTISTVTEGVETDPDGYSVSIDGQPGQAIGLNTTLTVDQIAAGEHTVELSGIAGNCAVAGPNPQTVSVTPGATATSAFMITCASAAGSIQIVTTTSAAGGGQLDPDGYGISIDGQAAQPIGLNATLTVEGIADGPHTVTLSGIAGNCGVVGQNPQSVSVSGSTAGLSFEVICSSGTGSIQVATTTSGAGTDPDGFSLLLDGTDRGAIGLNAASSLTGITAGPHSIGLTGLAGNCQISGENPRAVSVTVGGTAQVAFAVSCAAPGTFTGNLHIATVTTGPSQDANGYLISVDGGPGQPIGTSATVTLSNVTAVQHTVELQGLAPNCGVTGSNPLGVAVQPGETAQVSFAVTCAATTGSLRITINGLPAGTNAAVTVAGPNSFSRPVTATSTIPNLAPGTYAVSAGNVTAGATTYTASVSSSTVPVAAGANPTVTVSYTPPTPPTLNLRIQDLYLTQSTQTLTSSVPLVSGRAGFLRVFVVANEANTVKPTVRVRLRNGSSPVVERTISAPGSSTPRTVQEGTLGSSWNLPVEAALIRSGLSIEATVDPGGVIPESNEGDNGSTKAPDVRSVPTARIRFVSVQQGSSAAGNVSDPGRLVALARRMHPLNAVDVDVRAGVFTASQPLQADGGGWDQVLGDLDALRVADPDGANRIYFGIAGLSYGRSDGIVGIAFPGLPSATTALGWDNTDDAGRVVAHELGHIWGRRHSPCGSPPDLDALYPHPDGSIGTVGVDVATTTLKPAASPDIMSYCFQNPWISDYTYRGVMDFRQAHPNAVLAASAQPSLLIWGRVVNGRPVLEPAFEIVTRPSLPSRPGPYS